MLRTIRAKFTGGALVPLEPVDIAEGDELLVTLQESTPNSVEAEDAGLAQAITSRASPPSLSASSVSRTRYSLRSPHLRRVGSRTALFRPRRTPVRGEPVEPHPPHPSHLRHPGVRGRDPAATIKPGLQEPPRSTHHPRPCVARFPRSCPRVLRHRPQQEWQCHPLATTPTPDYHPLNKATIFPLSPWERVRVRVFRPPTGP